MKDPTKEQIKELWEWCGFKPFKNRPKSGLPYSWDGWELPDSIFEVSKLPPIDLNNLFKYAVPKLQEAGKGVELYAWEHKGYRAEIYDVIKVMYGDPIASVDSDNPALALFWAIYKVIK